MSITNTEYIQKGKVLELWRYWKHIEAYDQTADLEGIDLVFCEDCRNCIEKGTGTDCPSGYGYLYCNRLKSIVDEDFYCGWGEREGE